jgi:hypothetical protein
MIKRTTIPATADEFVEQQNKIRTVMGIKKPYAPEGQPVTVPAAPQWDGKFGIGFWRMRNGQKASVVEDVIISGELTGIFHKGNGRYQLASWTYSGKYLGQVPQVPHDHDLIAPWVEPVADGMVTVPGVIDAAGHAALAGIDWAKPGTDRTGFAVVMPSQPDLERQIFDTLPEMAACLFRLIIAHDGSLGEALSRAIVARAEQVGLPALVNVSPPSMRPKE